MVLVERRGLWIAVIGWFFSMFAMHVAFESGALPFHFSFDASPGQKGSMKGGYV